MCFLLFMFETGLQLYSHGHVKDNALNATAVRFPQRFSDHDFPGWGFALSGEVLFFAPPKKSTQKKRGPEACPSCSSKSRGAGFPVRFSAKPALAQLAISLALDSLRHGLACPGFPCDARLRLRGEDDAPCPVAFVESKRNKRGI
jgi:hypothetical protein